MELKKTKKISTMQIIAVGFVVIILIGTFLLSLPVASRNGIRIPFIDALFTATSSLCVTGLVVYDTYTQFTLFGQLVILTLIQIGGLGFMSMATMISLLIGKKIGLKERGLLMETMNTNQIGGVVKLLRKIIVITFSIEIVSAAILSIRFIPLLGTAKGIYYGLFHSISAFCNAGFDLMGIFEARSSLITFNTDVLVNIVVMSLIVIGGLGFIVWDDLMKNKFKFSKYRLHTKIVLIGTAVLILIPAVIFFFLENSNTLEGMTAGQKIMASVFQVITPRTAGFNTVDTASLGDGTTFMTMLLMIIGANPGSTGGGIKVTTLFVIILTVKAYVTHSQDLNAGGRRLEEYVPRKAFSITTLYLLLSLFGAFLIMSTQQLGMKETVFEALSAIGTVGLSSGITLDLNAISKTVIILLMYCGRVGSLTVLSAFAGERVKPNIRNIEEKIVIG